MCRPGYYTKHLGQEKAIQPRMENTIITVAPPPPPPPPLQGGFSSRGEYDANIYYLVYLKVMFKHEMVSQGEATV